MVFKCNVWIDSVVTVHDTAVPVIGWITIPNVEVRSETQHFQVAVGVNVEYGSETTYSEAEEVKLVVKLTKAKLTTHKVVKATKKNFLNCIFFFTIRIEICLYTKLWSEIQSSGFSYLLECGFKSKKELGFFTNLYKSTRITSHQIYIYICIF